MKAIGLVELPNCTDAIQALDVMLKTADVQFLTWEKKLGGRLVTLIVQGNVAAVTEAVEAAKHRAVGRVVASTVFSLVFVHQMVGFFNLTDVEAYDAAISYTRIACGLIVFSFMTMTLTQRCSDRNRYRPVHCYEYYGA